MHDIEVEQSVVDFTGSETIVWRILDGKEEIMKAEWNRDMSYEFCYQILSSPERDEVESLIDESEYTAEGPMVRKGRVSLWDKDGKEVQIAYRPNLKLFSNEFPSSLLYSSLQKFEGYSEEESDEFVSSLEDVITEISD